MQKSRAAISGAAWVFYLVIVFEFLFMITPFALYFYSAYQPALAFLNASPYSAWLTGFFLPHYAQTDSVLIELLNRAGWLLAYLGLALFLVSAVQLYASKLLRRGAVTGLLYRHIRHPQYLALAILGLGTTLIWPRFIVLIAFVFMLFIYRWLARFEEENCLQKYGEPYRDYLQQTGRFLPRFGRSNPAPSSGDRRTIPRLAGLAVHAGLLALVVAAALLLREHSLNSVSAIYRDHEAIVSPALMPEDRISAIFETAVEGAGDAISVEGEAPLLVYVVPRDWYLPDLPIDSHETVRQRGGHGTPARFDSDRFSVLFTQIRSHAARPQGRDILRRAHGYDPLLVVEVDAGSGTVTDRFKPPSGVIWGDISSPLL